MAEMAWCQSCKTVIWAYDHQIKVDMRGIANMLRLLCPKCGKLGDFDGWGGDAYERAKKYETEDSPVYDDWSGLKAIARLNGITKWEISPDCSWFKRPHMHNGNYNFLMSKIQELVKEQAGE